MSIEDEIVLKEGAMIFSHAPDEVFVEISSGEIDCRRLAIEVLMKCIIMKFIVVRGSIRPELVVNVIIHVAGGRPPNAAGRRLHLVTRDVQLLQLLRRRRRRRRRRRFLLLIPGMAKEHGRGATADDTYTKWCNHGIDVDIHGAR